MSARRVANHASASEAGIAPGSYANRPWSSSTITSGSGAKRPPCDIRPLLDHAAGNARTAAAQRSRLVGVVVATCVDHERVALQRGQALQMRRGNRGGVGAIGANGDAREVAFMTHRFGALMLAGVLRIEVTTGGEGRTLLAILLARIAAGLLMQVEAMVARRQAL